MGDEQHCCCMMTDSNTHEYHSERQCGEVKATLKTVCILDMHCHTMDIAMHPDTLSLDGVIASRSQHQLKLPMVFCF